MKRVIGVLLAVALVTLVLAPTPAAARGRLWGGFVVGGLTGLIVGGALAAPYYAPPAVVYPYSVPPGAYVAPPPAYAPPSTYPGAAPVYMPPQWVWNGYQWVWQPGYWRY